MKFRIPFSLSNLEKLKKRSKFFSSKIRHKKKTKLEQYLKNCDVNVKREEYIGICIRNFLISFCFIFVISLTILFFLSVKKAYLFSFLLALLFGGFIFFSQMNYPKIYVNRKQGDIEKNLLPALGDILIQLNSGIPLFNIMSNISYSDYGYLSLEFKKAVKRISAGEPESRVLEDLGKNNNSLFFRRTLWQITNGLIAGSDMSIVIRDSIKALNEEQLLQIQDYGNKLNPLVVMYMLISVIVPSLSIAFLTVISSMLSLSEKMIPLLFIALFVFVLLLQVMFLGIIRSRRPSLM